MYSRLFLTIAGFFQICLLIPIYFPLCLRRFLPHSCLVFIFLDMSSLSCPRLSSYLLYFTLISTSTLSFAPLSTLLLFLFFRRFYPRSFSLFTSLFFQSLRSCPCLISCTPPCRHVPLHVSQRHILVRLRPSGLAVRPCHVWRGAISTQVSEWRGGCHVWEGRPAAAERP